ncbi:MAG: 3-dehydroquinate synthase, partial [Flavobacteriales bacterium]|nr:3-dehydroquinate synthase [Flavobacteriales bacterium]
VIIDSGFLKTLPEREYKSGMAEVLKHAFISDPCILRNLDVTETLISRSVEVKTKIVALDALDNGERKKLNFGHTIGHAIESHLLESDNPVLHGEAIAAGMIMEAWLSHKILGLSEAELASIASEIDTIFSRIPLSDVDWNAIKQLMLYDKKNRNGNVLFVLLSSIGNALIDQEASEELLDGAFRFYTGSA